MRLHRLSDFVFLLWTTDIVQSVVVVGAMWVLCGRPLPLQRQMRSDICRSFCPKMRCNVDYLMRRAHVTTAYA